MTDAWVQHYLDHGYVVVPDVLDEPALVALEAEITRLARGEHGAGQLPPVPEGTSDAEALADIYCVFNAHQVSDTVARLASHPGLTEVLGRIVGAHLPWWDGAVKCVQSQVFVKPPGFQGMAWHQDEAYIPTRDRSLCAAWVAVDDATEVRGCLRVIPGSHRTGYLFPQRDHGDLEEFDWAPEATGFDQAREVVVEVPRGHALFLNGYLMHRSTRNRGEGLRRVLSYHYMNSWSLLPWHHPRGIGAIAMADVRRVLQVHGDDPYAWKGYDIGGDVALRTCKANEARIQRRFAGSDGS